MRLLSKKKPTKDFAKKSFRFVEIRHKHGNSIVVPRVFSENRKYIISDFLTDGVIVKDSAYAIYDAKPWIFGVISSKMHIAWVRAVAGIS